MYLFFITSELKKWLRDPLLSFMLAYPIVFALLGRYGVPWLAKVSGINMALFADLVLVVLTLMTPHIFGALIGFSILEDRDDHVLTSIQVTPLSVAGYLSFRFVLVTVLACVSTWFILWFSQMGGLTLSQMGAVALLSSFAAPLTGLIINATASNKIEGFVAMKGIIGILIIFPIISLFFMDAKEFIFAIAPGFWPAKVISSIVRGEGVLLLSQGQYYWFGFIYAIILNVLVAKGFSRRVQY
ncbi:MAG TPA: ABC transporter permease [Firmicutes bacterium]|jgi:fluoroquinolone transport system permease protein|nr:ABC transporter permease [Bacillota bacterium]